ncbi:hypothetical protein O181_015555 [Austropuccinia psidii MF-1]|uniref:Uncharacterized protein n=1 Tax=Austropuccinia psidii MF-1 TaxID=1389203 RepID=A0A9Q3GR26_9BASI|nr:hypothetical protein [Austropuccinia psidii MF-1]
MDCVFGSKENVSAFSEMDTTNEGEVIDLNSDVEDESNSGSGLSSYENSQCKAFDQHQEDIEGIDISRQHNLPKVSLDQKAHQKGKMNLIPKRPQSNLKYLHHRHEQETQKFHRQVIQNYVSLEEKKLVEEKKTMNGFIIEKRRKWRDILVWKGSKLYVRVSSRRRSHA